MMRTRHWLALLCLSAMIVPAFSAAPDEDIVVQVRKDGPEIVVEVDCPVRAPLLVVWNVLTDYDSMTSFISNVAYSTVCRSCDWVRRW